MTKEEFLDECRTAKVVVTGTGPAILIGRIVFNVNTFPGAEGYVEWLASALRDTAPAPIVGGSLGPFAQVSETGGSLATKANNITSQAIGG